MLRWFLLSTAVLLLALGLLNVFKVPDWAAWQLTVLTGEYGHWLVALPLLVGGGAWVARGGALPVALVTVVLSAVAAALFLRPIFAARRIARDLPAQFDRQFGQSAVAGGAKTPFSVAGLAGRSSEPVAVQTLPFAGELALDFYRPTRRDKSAAPCIVIVHGGGWDSGDRKQVPQFNHWLAGRGYAVAAISYRLAPRFQWPAQRDDTLAAIAFLKARAGELGIDPQRMVLMGRSAGGQIAQAVGYTARDPAIRGVVGLYAPADLNFGYAHAREDDLLKSPALMRQYLGGTPDTAGANYDSASAYLHVARSTPPTLLIHGEIDALVWHRHSVRLSARLAEHGVPHVFVSLPWASHAFEFNLHGPGGQLTTYALERFLAAVCR